MYAFKDPDICKAIDELRLTKSEEELIPYLWTFSKSERAYNDDIYYAGKAGEARVLLLCLDAVQLPRRYVGILPPAMSQKFG